MQNIEWSRKLRLRPWVGTSYWTQNVRTLILGESHYGISSRAGLDFTTETIEKTIAGTLESPRVKAFFTKTARIVVGGSLDEYARKSLWQSVAFYNYLQEIVSGPRVAVEGSLFELAGPAFEEVLLQLDPNLVIVLGQRNWDNMTICDGRAFKDENRLPNVGAGGRYRELWRYPTAKQANAIVFHVKHPSTAFISSDFRPLYEAAHRMCERSLHQRRCV